MRHLWKVLCLAALVTTTAACAPTAPEFNRVDLRAVPLNSQALPSGLEPGRIANYFLTARIAPILVDSLARYDAIITGAENASNNPEVLDAIRLRNPKTKLCFYMQSNEITIGHDEPADGPWHQLEAQLDSTCFLYDEFGQPVSFWPGSRSYDLTNPRVPDILAAWCAAQYARYNWDGDFKDNVWPKDVTWYNGGHVDTDRDGRPDSMPMFSQKWIAGLVRLGTQSRALIGPSRLLLGNISGDAGTDHRFWTTVANGRMFEGFPRTLPTDELADAYLGANWQSPGSVIIHIEANAWETERIRSAWAFTLLGNGYFAVDHGPTATSDPGDTGWHDQWQWHAEIYDQPRGRPVTGPFRDKRTGCWFREFERLIVAWNPSPATQEIQVILRDDRTMQITVPGLTGLTIPKP